MPRGSRVSELDALELSTATNVPLWFIAAFEDGRSTPDFLVCYEVELRAALEAAGTEFP